MTGLLAADPLFSRRRRHDRRAHRHRQDDRGLRAAPALGAALHLVPAQGDRADAEPHRPRPRRAVRPAPDARRRHQAVLQGAVVADDRRPAASSCSRRTSRCSPRSSRSASCRSAASSTIAGHTTYLQLADLPVRHPVAARDVGHRALRRDARRLVVGLEVPAARLGAGVGAAAQLRSGVRPRHRRRARAREHAVDARASCRPAGLGRHRVDRQRRLVLAACDRRAGDLRDRGDRRDQPPAVRPRRGRAGAHRRLHHRVHRHPLRDLLPRRVHERDHDVRDRGHALLRRPDRPGARVPRRPTAGSTPG